MVHLPAPRPATLPGVELLWCGRVSDHAEDAVAHRGLLDADEAARLAAFHRSADRDAYAVAHVTLRRLLGERLGQTPQAVTMAREPCTHCSGPHGRPHVPGYAVHFSLSHTGGIVMIALAEAPVGIDVEALPDPATVSEVAARLHPRERTELAALPAAERPAAFARCWTRKEALLKATGVGLNEDLSLTHVGAGPQPATHADWLVADLATDPGYAAALAVRRRTDSADSADHSDRTDRTDSAAPTDRTSGWENG
ncbi:4'-phosphopantetheinyl transferase superfamily protein [Streptomyces sp. NBC_01142]|uniref:4'-phosphopantetheinyl transferase family protein n=1 Tax=Streptomyces sp. NBC_01142 TaxID=2975865 RepID=UPI00224ECEA5|nr:4'-phosphopantetheinyl transferase superfamily protein [Streptomyces sp. NBC_01142]MCX4824717.1 4'-phosphopantetheinyl transferase superfamily protein [Streptomyces sp. NBC_01142]